MMKYIIAIAVCILWVSTGANAGSIPDDPLNSPVWKDIAIKQFGDAEVVFDERVKVLVPSVVEIKPRFRSLRMLANCPTSTRSSSLPTSIPFSTSSPTVPNMPRPHPTSRFA